MVCYLLLSARSKHVQVELVVYSTCMLHLTTLTCRVEFMEFFLSLAEKLRWCVVWKREVCSCGNDPVSGSRALGSAE